MRGGGFVCWCHSTFGEAEVSDLNRCRKFGGAASRGVRLKGQKCGDDVGLTAELLKHAPAEFWDHLLSVYNDSFHHGTVPRSWCCTFFDMLPKKARPTQVIDPQPTANIRAARNFSRPEKSSS